MAHGQLDPVVPESLGQRSRAALEALGMAIDWHVYAMPHSVCAEEIRDLGDWMHQRFLAG
jgi:phospholipase/carboxylesterase